MLQLTIMLYKYIQMYVLHIIKYGSIIMIGIVIRIYGFWTSETHLTVHFSQKHTFIAVLMLYIC